MDRVNNRPSRPKGGAGTATYVALSADHLVAVKLGGKGLERWLDDTTTETEHKVQSRFLQTRFISLGFQHFCFPHITKRAIAPLMAS